MGITLFAARTVNDLVLLGINVSKNKTEADERAAITLKFIRSSDNRFRRGRSTVLFITKNQELQYDKEDIMEVKEEKKATISDLRENNSQKKQIVWQRLYHQTILCLKNYKQNK